MSKNVCDNCGWFGMDEDMHDIDNLEQRVDPGSVVPSGQCPECGALCYLGASVGGKDGYFTIVGYWDDNQQPFMDHIEAKTPAEALEKLSCILKDEEVIEGKVMGVSGFDNVTRLSDLFRFERTED
jgi:hypothetical protein